MINPQETGALELLGGGLDDQPISDMLLNGIEKWILPILFFFFFVFLSFCHFLGCSPEHMEVPRPGV